MNVSQLLGCMMNPVDRQRSMLLLLLVFVTGILTQTWFTSTFFAHSSTQESCTTQVRQHHSATEQAVPPGIYPLLRDFQCGHENMETPRVLRGGTEGGGRQRIVVDVGLDQGEETLDAVQQGFIVLGFEMLKGSVQRVVANAEKRGIRDRIHVVEFDLSADDKSKFRGLPVPKDLPQPAQDGRGFAYIFNAGVSDEPGAIDPTGGSNPGASLNGVGKEQARAWEPGLVPVVTLEQVLPEWVDEIFYLKIDTQGWEHKVLQGALPYLQSNKVQYAQYEFSPKLMRGSETGDPLDLLLFMSVSMGAVCFDMMGSHHVITRPSTSLEQYLHSIDSGLNSTHKNAPKYESDPFGPWDDILCWFPRATK